MLILNLHVQPHTEQKIKKILNYAKDEEIFAQNIIAYEIAELQKGIINLKLDLKEFEEKYLMPSEVFYQRFEQGLLNDNEDFIVWSGIYEMLESNIQRLSELR